MYQQPLRSDELMHYGVLGMHWGIRRYQPYSVRGRKSGKGGKEIGDARHTNVSSNINPNISNDIYNTLSESEKRYVTGVGPNDKTPKNYTNKNEYDSYLAKSFVAYDGNKPVSIIDIWRENDNDVAISIMTRSNYRGKGYAKDVARRGIEFFENSSFDNAYWDVEIGNESSRKLAENLGFEYSGKGDHDDYVMYVKKNIKHSALDNRRSKMSIYRRPLWPDELMHYGVLGMHWGIRRYQPYSVRGRKSGKGGKELGQAARRVSEGSKAAADRVAKAVKSIDTKRKTAKANKEKQKEIKKKNLENQARQYFNSHKEEILRSGDPDMYLKYKRYMTDQEIKAAVGRMNDEIALRKASSSKNPTFQKKLEKATKTAGDVYKLTKTISSTTSEINKIKTALGGVQQADKAVNATTEKLNEATKKLEKELESPKRQETSKQTKKSSQSSSRSSEPDIEKVYGDVVWDPGEMGSQNYYYLEDKRRRRY